jgi:cysteine desulfurase
MSSLICLDHNANTYVYNNVRKEMNKLYKDMSMGNASSKHSMGEKARNVLNKSRNDIAKCFGIPSDFVTFTSGATESINMMILGRARLVQPTDRVVFVSTRVEHPAVLNCFRYIQNNLSPQIEVCYMETEVGLVKGRVFREFMKEKSKEKKIDLVSFSYVNHELGSVMSNISTMVKICHKYGALFHSDMTQAAGKIDVNMKEIGADAISFSGHKFHGPMGVGCLLVSPEVKLQQLMFGGDQENKRRPGTENVVGIFGMSLALKMSLKHYCKMKQHYMDLYKHIKKSLDKNKINYRLNSCKNFMSSTMSLSLANVNASEVVAYLNEKHICISRGTACKAYSKEGSNVINSLSLPPEMAEGTIRISFGENTTMQNVDQFIVHLVEFLSKKNK